MKVEIEIPDPPEGWLVDGFRRANKGERWWDGGGWHDCTYSASGHYLVCVKAKLLWEPSPELVAVLQPGWIAKNFSGTCFWYREKPRKLSYFWEGTTASFGLRIINSKLLPPDSIPWDQCCFKIGEPQE